MSAPNENVLIVASRNVLLTGSGWRGMAVRFREAYLVVSQCQRRPKVPGVSAGADAVRWPMSGIEE
jgi:hypothetical protein